MIKLSASVRSSSHSGMSAGRRASDARKKGVEGGREVTRLPPQEGSP